MASIQSRKRDPLLDSTTQAAIEKRSTELLGFALIGLGVLIAAMIWTYSPDDPSWISATDAPVQNWLGQTGASIAAPLMMVIGKGAWMIPVGLIGWGVRCVAHYGHDRAISRAVFVPFAVIAASLYAATLPPSAGWAPNFGLGGLLGDTVLGALLIVLPIGTTVAVKLMSLVLAVVMLALGAFSLGFIREELRSIGRFLFVGVVLAYAMVLRLMGRGAVASAKVAGNVRETVAAKRAEAQARRDAMDEIAAVGGEAGMTLDTPPMHRTAVVRPETYDEPERRMPPLVGAPNLEAAIAEPMVAPAREEPEQKGFLASLLKRKSANDEAAVPASQEDRISARIAAAVSTHKNPEPKTELGSRLEPSLTRGKGPQPMILNTSPVVPVTEGDSPMMEAAMTGMALDEAVIDEMTPDLPPEPALRPVLRRGAGTGPEMEEVPAEPVAIPTPAPKKVVQHPLKRATMPSKQALRESQPNLPLEDKYADYETPPLALLRSPDTVERHHLPDEALEENARMLESVLDDYGVKGEIVSVRPGPVVTMYELEPAAGLKASRVIGLADDIARSMSALSARVSTVPGRSVIGIELPNEKREMVVLREMLSARDFGDGNLKLPLALGKDIGGEPIIANLAKMPHLLIAGTTGSGKSVAINTMILSLLYKLSPEECRMIMIDPKMLELSVYDGIPHLLSPVVTDPKKAVVALKWVVGEMEERYRKMSKMGVRNIDGYNGRVKETLAKGEMFSRTVQTGFDDETGDPVFETEEFKPEVLPYIVVIVDEMADLMMVAGKEIEACIQRLAQMARASGIHLIMATQRPSVDVITGTIKANFPTRISFQVTSKIDSRTILGEMGAEQLLGMGDMLYMAGGGKINRIHGPFCSDEEVEEIVNHLKAFGPPEYMSGVVEGPADEKEADIDAVLGLGGNTNGEDALYDQAVAIVIKDRKCSTSYIQRKLAIGYNKAARLVEQMEEEGVVSSANHVGKREILVPEQA